MVNKFSLFLGSETDNIPLVLWRILWGFLILAECSGAILSGWVNEILIEANFTFTFIGFEWLQPLPGDWMYVYYGFMSILGIAIMLGYRYRLSSFLFFLMWTVVYLMQKSHYNNHYYLMVIVSFLMIWMPSHRAHSLDSKAGRIQSSDRCSRWQIWIFILLIGLVYITASLNKLHADWLDAKPLKIWFSYKTHYPILGGLLAKEWFAYVIAWGGVLYDGMIFFLLLHPKTRKLAFFLSLIFNLFNSAVFQIGVFPYMMIASTVLFFPGESLRRVFFRNSSNPIDLKEQELPNWSTAVFIFFFIVNGLLPLRHHLFKGDVHWTEEGHRLSWQMMLRAKSARTTFYVEDKSTGNREKVDLKRFMTRNQRNDFGGKPDMIWQFAQYLKRHHADLGKDISVYVISNVSLNGSERVEFIDPNVDLAAVPWERYKHSEWILDENRPTQ